MHLRKILDDVKARYGLSPPWALEAWHEVTVPSYGPALAYLQDVPASAFINTARQFAACRHRNSAYEGSAFTGLRPPIKTWPDTTLDIRVDRLRRMLPSSNIWVDGRQHPVLKCPEVYNYLGLLCLLAAWREDDNARGLRYLYLASRFNHVNCLTETMPRAAVEHLELALSMLFDLPEEQVKLRTFAGTQTPDVRRPSKRLLGFWQVFAYTLSTNLRTCHLWRSLWDEVLLGSVLAGFGQFVLGLCGLVGWVCGSTWTWTYLLLWCPLRDALWRRDIVTQLVTQHAAADEKEETQAAQAAAKEPTPVPA